MKLLRELRRDDVRAPELRDMVPKLLRVWELRQSDITVAIKALGKRRLWPEALALLEVMDDVRLERDIIMYNAVMTACKNGDVWQTALQLLSEANSIRGKAEGKAPRS